MRLNPPPGRRLVRDWQGSTVTTKRDLSNGMGFIPKGTVATVTDVSPGLSLQAVKCPHCGAALRITRIGSDDVELVRLAPGIES